MFNVNEKVVCINNKVFDYSENKPPLEEGKEYKIEAIQLDSKGNQHLHVGIKSNLNYVRSKETLEELKDGDKFHWCHPSRFQKI